MYQSSTLTQGALIKEIKESGWTPYIIKDMGKANKDFVKEKFDEFLKYLKENTII